MRWILLAVVLSACSESPTEHSRATSRAAHAEGEGLTAAQPANEIAATLTDWLSEYDMRNPGPDEKRIAAKVGPVFLRIPVVKRKAVLDNLSKPIWGRAFHIGSLYVSEPEVLLKMQFGKKDDARGVANTLYLMPAYQREPALSGLSDDERAVAEGALFVKLLDVLPGGEIDAALVSSGTSEDIPSESYYSQIDPAVTIMTFGMIPVEARSALFAELLD